MNHGKLGGKNKVTEVFNYLVKRQGQWCDSWHMTIELGTSAISTRISEVRHVIPGHYEVEHKQEGQKHFYRIVHRSLAERLA